MSDCFVLYLLLTCMKKKTSGADKFTNNNNGQKMMPERQELRLSDAYERKSEKKSMELIIEVVNINPGNNQELMEKSPTLHQYMQFVECIRTYQKDFPFKIAVEKAINECIQKGILESFLKKNKAEVLRMSIFEYDQEKHIQQERDASREEGRQEERIKAIENMISLGLTKEKILTKYSEEEYEEAEKAMLVET